MTVLKLINGPAKSGKTTAVFNMISEDAKNGRKALLIVPEQITFTYEKKLAQLKIAAEYAEATSFSRLAELVLRRHGGDPRPKMTESAAFFMMNVALEEIADELSVYSRHYRSHGFLTQMIDFVGECDDAGIRAEDLALFSYKQPEGLLREKSYELSLILDAYRAVVARSYMSETDSLTAAAKAIAESDDFVGANVYIDGFTGFTACEYELIETLLKRADHLCAALPGKEINSELSPFAYADATAKRLRKLAEKHGIECSEISLSVSEKSDSLSSDFLKSLENGFSAVGETITTERIEAVKASDPADEAEKTACRIAKLVREEGLRYRDIAVVMRDDARYKTLLPAALSRFEIPYFYDMRTKAESSALIQAVLAAVEIAAGEWEGDYLKLIKSPAMGLDPVAVGETENYCFVWSVKRSAWGSPFVNNPDGMVGHMSDMAKERLTAIESCRKAVFFPVMKLKEAMKSQNGRTFATGVYDFLSEIKACDNLVAFAEGMPDKEKRDFLEQQSLLWDKLMEILDLFASLGDDVALASRRMYELMNLSLSTVKVATPPRTLDEVVVGTADRMRIENAKAVFIVGAVYGEFPACTAPGGILSDEERKYLIEEGLTLLGDSDRFLEHERLLAYTAASAATDRLIVSYPENEMTGEELFPSEIFSLAREYAAVRKEKPFENVVNEKTALRAYAAAQKETEEKQTLLEACEKLGLRDEVNRIDRAAGRLPHRITDAPMAMRLFGNKMRLSPSRIEEYYRCPYAYFADSGLKVRPLQKAELSPAQAGTLIHRVLERTVSKYGANLKDIEESVLKADIKQETECYLREVVGDIENMDKRLAKGFERIGKWLCELLRRLGNEFSQSSFVPVAFELPIGEEGVKSLTLTTADGAEISVRGTVDRVDTAEINGQRYVRVVDYKSGTKKFKLDDVFYGLNMQMLIYLFSIWQNGNGELANSLPAGVLYMPAMGKYHSVERNDDEAAEKKTREQYRMNGLILDDSDVISAMEHGGGGIFIPVKDGQKKSDSLASLAQIGRLRRLVEEKITGMAESLHKGEIDTYPMRLEKTRTQCDMCDYRGICGFDGDGRFREMVKIDREDILGKEETDDGI